MRALFLALGLGVLVGCGGSSSGSPAAAGSPTEGGGAGGVGGLGGAQGCATGTETCSCYGNDTCDDELSCFSGVCVFVPGGGAGGVGSEAAGGSAGSGGSSGAPPKECVPGCLGEYEECIDGECVAPCTYETAKLIAGASYDVDNDACLLIELSSADDLYFTSTPSVDVAFRNTCGDSGEFTAVSDPNEKQLPTCETTLLELLGDGEDQVHVFFHG